MNIPKRYLIKPICATALCSLAACSTNTVKTQSAFDFSNPGRIEMQISADDGTVIPKGLAEEVSKNLIGWNYPMGTKNGESYSHILKAKVGVVTHSATPTGFSFSAGNSDPRAIDFQKADVLPITCVLTAIAHPDQASELKLGFVEDKTSKVFSGEDKLADHISTVCFNLLSEVKWPKKAEKTTGSTTIKSPSWMPEIRIETKEAPVGAVEKPSTTDNVQATPNKAGDSKDIEVKTVAPANTEHKKQIIIYNQGAPVILEFGHERR